jgi:ribonuclease HII
MCEVGLLIGMDEAGYGPNLGPLVVSVTVWEVPGDPREFDLAAAMDEVVTSAPARNDRRLHIADSKQVYSPTRGMDALERSVLCALKLCGLVPTGLRELCELLAVAGAERAETEPWFDDGDVELPTTRQTPPVDELTNRWKACSEEQGVRLRAIRSDVVLTQRFNRMTREYGSKGLTLSRTSLRLLRSVWNPDDGQPTYIVADKHGGRNRYDDLIAETFDDDRMIIRGVESTARSDYRVGATHIRFQTKAEEHLPVALASMVCKYVRELAMMQFNRFWAGHLAGLRPTKGYPVDAKRFKKDIAEVQAVLGIEDDVLWRER